MSYAQNTTVNAGQTKQQLEAIDTGIVTFESEFLAHLQLPSGQTVGETIIPQIKAGSTVTLALPGGAS